MASKRDFEAVATALREFASDAPSSYELQRTRSLAGDIASAFERMNKSFDRERFMVAIFGTNR